MTGGDGEKTQRKVSNSSSSSSSFPRPEMMPRRRRLKVTGRKILKVASGDKKERRFTAARK
jgi:hypothetical protein